MVINYIVNKCWCGASDTKEFYNGFWFADKTKVEVKLGRCVECDTVRTLYANNTSQVDYNETSVYTAISYRHERSIKTIVSYIQYGNLLEIGCSTGLILNEIVKKRKDIEVLGIDLNKKALENTVNGNLNLRYGDIEGLSSTFNNVILMHVIEHIPDLNSFFNKLLKVSQKDTIIYISLPNIESFNFKRRKEAWGALNPLEHSWHFSQRTFRKAVENFLPNSKILCCKTSWVWKPRLVGFLGNVLLEGDQIEVVIKL